MKSKTEPESFETTFQKFRLAVSFKIWITDAGINETESIELRHFASVKPCLCAPVRVYAATLKEAVDSLFVAYKITTVQQYIDQQKWLK